MEKVKIGIIGTGNISQWFVEGALAVEGLEISAIYSRNKQTAMVFANKNNIKNVYTDINEFAKSDLIDAVYVASPNSKHCEYAVLMMQHKKHVLCEKAFASNSNEVSLMIKEAKENDVVLMEAMKLTQLPNFKSILENIYKIGKVRRYFASYCQYSSRYDKYKEGVILNAFNPEFSNGALMDIGVYTLAPMIALFGKPNFVKCNAYMLESGVDGEGSVICNYDGMDAVCIYSKIANSYIPSEIQGEEGSIIINNLNGFGDVKIIYKDGTEENLSVEQDKNVMSYEINEFVELIRKNEKESKINSLRFSKDLISVMDDIRTEIGLRFPADR